MFKNQIKEVCIILNKVKINYCLDGNVEDTCYYKNNKEKDASNIFYSKYRKLYKKDRLAEILYYKNGNIKEETHYQDNIVIESNEYYENGNLKNKRYYKDGLLHRENGPAIIRYHEFGKIKNEIYYLNGLYCSNKLEYMVKII